MMMFRTIVVVGAIGLLTACGQTAGSNVGDVSFGEATTQNLLTQAAYINPEARVIAMNDRFKKQSPNMVNFDFDRSGLGKDARRILATQAAWLKKNDNVKVHVYGHTDLVGGESYNNRLGLRRARAAARYLISRGVSRSRVDVVASRGENEPLVPTQERERRNRRAVTAVAGFVSGFVGDGLDGKRARLAYRRYTSDTVEDPVDTGVVASGG